MSFAETDASQLEFGPDFTPPEPLTTEMMEGMSDAQIAREQGERAKRNVDYMMNDEVMVLLSSLDKKRNDGDTAKATLEYLQKISGNADINTLNSVVNDIRGQLTSEQYNTKDQMQRSLHQFEVAQLANMVATEADVEEAVTWIPSLGNIEETEMAGILEKLANCKAQLQ